MKIKLSTLMSPGKAAHAAAYFLFMALKQNGNLTLLKLMKLMYLAERTAYKKYGEPIIGDALVSMPHGPVLSRTLDYLNDGSSSPIWDVWISKNDRNISLSDPTLIRSPEQDLTELSKSDLEILNDVWLQFGHMSAYALRDYTHDPANCPEWEDPDGSSKPIPYQKLFTSLGYSEDEAEFHEKRLMQRAWVASSLLT